MSSYWSKVGSQYSLNGRLIKECQVSKQIHTEKNAMKDEGRDEGDVSTSQETPNLANKTPEAR